MRNPQTTPYSFTKKNYFRKKLSLDANSLESRNGCLALSLALAIRQERPTQAHSSSCCLGGG